MKQTRRDMLKLSASALASLAWPRRGSCGESREEDLPPVRQITRGPKFHWFGYYDKLEFDPSCRYVLAGEVGFEHRSPRKDDVIRVGMVDLKDNDRWVDLGKSSAWCWQQGCMLQWRPGSDREILWNDRDGDRFVCRILDVFTGKMRTVPHPIYAVSPCGKWAVTADFRRINDMRPGYGYAGLSDPHAGELAPDDSGIREVDLETGKARLVVSLAEVAAIPFAGRDTTGAKHYFNHLLVSPDGGRFEFLHRWRKGRSGFVTRMLTAARGGSDIRVIDPSGYTSHFIWRDPRHILAWSRRPSHGNAFYLFEDREGGAVEVVGAGAMKVNGHCSYIAGGEWILNDTYPRGKKRLQNPYLYNVKTGKVHPLGHFYLPPEYRGEWRCDTHPRSSPDGRSVVIDSPHTGQGRQLHLISIASIVSSRTSKKKGAPEGV